MADSGVDRVAEGGVSVGLAGHLTAPVVEMPTKGLPEKPEVSDEELRSRAEALTLAWRTAGTGWGPGVGPAGEEGGGALKGRLKGLSLRLKARLEAAKAIADLKVLTPQLELLESGRMLEAALIAADAAAATFAKVPLVRVSTEGLSASYALGHADQWDEAAARERAKAGGAGRGKRAGETLPRVMNLAEGYMAAASGIWSADSLAVYVGQTQRLDALLLEEVRLLPQALKLAELEYILDRADEYFAGTMPQGGYQIEESPFSAPLHSLRRLNQFEWRMLLESLVAFDTLLRQDPAGVFGRMEDETRASYQMRVAELAAHADMSELETARVALELAKAASLRTENDPRVSWRLSHIGYYLFAEGLGELRQRIGYHPPPMERVRDGLRRWNEDFYILGIFTLSLLLIVVLIAPLVPHHDFWEVMFALVLALLPATQGGVDLVNGTVSSLLHAESLPKVDFSRGVPEDATTLVIVPTLLLNERQVRELFEELEARYLSNQDPNVHFGLLTDLADSVAKPFDEDRNPLVVMAVRMVEELNEKYRNERGGGFVMLHRYRVFNARQGVWMGWERKRGKLMDLNKLLLREQDGFPVKAGRLEVLSNIRYVITLDSDTQLPRGTAARMAGTMAHPLNQAIIEPRRRIVTAGYGILQPRVGVSVSSASRSRLAALYSGETGFDIYTRAVSDVYQDLFGEGIFAGKGIYEVSVLHQVLERRFPRNSLLSHDLIEGAYVRAGLVTDIEIIDDYPSHYSAHTRRKHRWVRGDWQIAPWIFSKVPDEEGKQVENPISTISRWKILDNLRRSLLEPVTFLLLVSGWFFLTGGPLYWTAATIILLLLPSFVQLGFNLGRAALKLSWPTVRDGLEAFAGSVGLTLLNLTFLPHHMLLSLDAILRSLSRRFISGKHLLEWETAAQAEAGGASKRTPLDWYLRLSPVVALVFAAMLVWLHPVSHLGPFLVAHLGRYIGVGAARRSGALVTAAPVLLLWALAPLVSRWLNASPRRTESPLSEADTMYLRQQALAIWRYFAEFGDERNQWLIPDNVEEKGLHQVKKLSPTNLGMLLNARQAAYEFGFITLPELTRASLGTLATYEQLEKQRGHIYNWYDMETLKAIAPLTVSAVDSGNLAAGFYTLHTGALDLLKRPVFAAEAFAGLALMRPGRYRSGSLRSLVAELMAGAVSAAGASSDPGSDEDWVAAEAGRRELAVRAFVEGYVPWLLPEFDALFAMEAFRTLAEERLPSLADSAAYVTELDGRLETTLRVLDTGTAQGVAIERLRTLLPGARERLARLAEDLRRVSAEAERYAEAMEYGFLLVEERQLLSIGYDGPTGVLHSACYDLLASEARIASFLAVAKSDIPQKAWFQLDRSHVLVEGRPCLLSWTGTMFEYMMPTLWMRNFPNTLISRSLESAVRIQKDHVKGIPWGISESGYATTDALGRYGYQAWGIPGLALKYGAEDGPVISPYSTFLALSVLRGEAIANLKKMTALGWGGAYGFYEAADYSAGGAISVSGKRREPELVRSWMAHHQGMSLLALTNLLKGSIVQEWFHANPRVRAAELLLHEKPLSKDTLKALEERTASAE